MPINLFDAIHSRDLPIVNQALRTGADPNAQHQDGYSALILASTIGYRNSVQASLDAGAAVNSLKHETYTYERAWSPLIAAILHRHTEVLPCLIDTGADVTSFYNLDERPEVLDTEDSDAVLNRIDISCTPIHVAVATEEHSIVKQLIMAKANVDAGDGANSPLTLAVHLQNIPIIESLIAADGDVSWEMENDKTALMTAAAAGNREIVNLLLAAGAQVNGWSQGESALSLAGQAGHQDVYDRLYPIADEENRQYADHATLAKGLRRKTRQQFQINP